MIHWSVCRGVGARLRSCALSGLGYFAGSPKPRALPWADGFRTVGAETVDKVSLASMVRRWTGQRISCRGCGEALVSLCRCILVFLNGSAPKAHRWSRDGSAMSLARGRAEMGGQTNFGSGMRRVADRRFSTGLRVYGVAEVRCLFCAGAPRAFAKPPRQRRINP